MARMRSIKPEYWLDRKLARTVSRDARLLYIGLWNYADEHGRLHGDPAVIKGQVFPYDDLDISPLLDELAAVGCVQAYSYEEDPYLFLPKLAKHQRLEAAKVESRLPEPPPFQMPSPRPQSVPRANKSAPRTNSSEKNVVQHVAGGMLHEAGSKEHVAGSRAAPAADDARTIVAAYVEGATSAGLPTPANSLCARVGKQAKAMLQTTDAAALVAAARSAGAQGWTDLAVEIQRMAASARGQPNKATARTNQGLAVYHNLQAEEQGQIA